MSQQNHSAVLQTRPLLLLLPWWSIVFAQRLNRLLFSCVLLPTSLRSVKAFKILMADCCVRTETSETLIIFRCEDKNKREVTALRVHSNYLTLQEDTSNNIVKI